MKIRIIIFALTAVFAVFSHTALAQTSLTSIDGARVDVQGQSGTVVILAIGAKWLKPSVKQAEYSNSLARKYAGKNVAIYFIATDSTNPRSKNYASDDDIRQFAAETRLTVTALRDPDGAATLKKFGIDQLPSFVVLDKEGNRSGEPFAGIDPGSDITVAISRKVDSLL
jgi:hypothetical protein